MSSATDALTNCILRCDDEIKDLEDKRDAVTEEIKKLESKRFAFEVAIDKLSDVKDDIGQIHNNYVEGENNSSNNVGCIVEVGGVSIPLEQIPRVDDDCLVHPDAIPLQEVHHVEVEKADEDIVQEWEVLPEDIPQEDAPDYPESSPNDLTLEVPEEPAEETVTPAEDPEPVKKVTESDPEFIHLPDTHVYYATFPDGIELKYDNARMGKYTWDMVHRLAEMSLGKRAKELDALMRNEKTKALKKTSLNQFADAVKEGRVGIPKQQNDEPKPEWYEVPETNLEIREDGEAVSVKYNGTSRGTYGWDVIYTLADMDEESRSSELTILVQDETNPKAYRVALSQTVKAYLDGKIGTREE